MLKGWVGLRARVLNFQARHPLFVLALVVVLGVALAEQRLIWGGTVVLALGLVWGWLKNWRQGFAWVLLGGIAVAGFSWRVESRDAAESALIRFGGGEMHGRVLADAKGAAYWSAPVRLTTGPSPGAKVWWNGRGELPVAGSMVSGRGSFSELPAPRNPGEFDQAAWLRNQGIAAAFDSLHSEGKVSTGRFARAAAEFRRGFRAAVTAGLEEESQQARVIRAIVIGEQPHDSEVMIAAFRNSGTLHAFSVSGLHVAMVGSIVWLILKALGIPRRWAVLVLLPLVFGYAWISGNSAPAVRSAWMAAVFLGAFTLRRRPDLLNALGAVLLAAMLWDGRMLFQPGVQLSYGVVAAISLGTAWTSRAFSWMAKPELYLPLALMTRWQMFWLNRRRDLAQSLGVSVAAGIGSTPLTAFHFGLITPISIFAGIALIPLVYMLLAVALFSVVLYPTVPAVSRAVNLVNGKIADACVATAKGFSAIPGGHFQLRKSNQPFLLVYDLERGDGAACFSGGSDSVLLDCAGPYSFKRQIVPSLRGLGLSPDSVVLSHPDGGHLGGGSPVWEAFPIRQALLPVQQSRSPSFRSWKAMAPEAGINLIQLSDLQSVELPAGARLEILHTPDPLAQNATADERAAIFRLQWRGWKLLLTSDAGINTETAILDLHKDISADVIIAGHHRKDLSLSDDFLDAVAPQAIIASNSSFPIEERLNPRRTEFWRSRGILVIDQAKAGGVTLTIDDSGALHMAGFADRSECVLRSRQP
jgi:competence protein ComEC